MDKEHTEALFERWLKLPDANQPGVFARLFGIMEQQITGTGVTPEQKEQAIQFFNLVEQCIDRVESPEAHEKTTTDKEA